MNNRHTLLDKIFGVMGISVLVKMVSFIKELVYSSNFGTSMESDAYYIANIVPNLVNAPWITGILMFFIPTYLTIFSSKGKKGADEYTSNILSVYTAVSFFLTVALVCASPFVVQLVAAITNATIDIDLTTELMRLSCISFPFTMIAWIYIHVCQANHSFVVPQVFSFVNITMSVLGLLFFAGTLGIYAVPVSSTGGWILQMVLQCFFARQYFQYYRIFDIRADYIKRTLCMAIPVFVSIAAEQLNHSVDNLLALNFSTGTVSVLNYAQKFFSLFNSLIPTAIVTVMYPILSKASSANEEYGKTIKRTEQILLEMVVPVACICCFWGKDLITFVFLRGKFSFEDVEVTADVLRLYAVALPFWGFKELYNRAFFVKMDSKTPMMTTVGSIAVNIVLSVFLSREWGISGIVIATTIACIIACAYNRAKVGDFVGGFPMAEHFPVLLQVAVASAGMTMAVFFSRGLLDLGLFLNLAFSFMIGGIAYILLLVILRNKDGNYLYERIKGLIMRFRA